MRFNRFADWVEQRVASATFFALCVLMVVVWAPSYFLFGSIDTWQLVINTLTTIITFLLVALLQNTQARFEDRTEEHQQEILERLDRIESKLKEAR